MQRNKIIDWFYEGGYPLTKILIVLSVLLLVLVGVKPNLAPYLLFTAPASLVAPWTIITYAFVVLSPIGLIFYGLMLWWFGSSLERSWGTKTYALFFAAMAIIPALAMCLAAVMLKSPVMVNYYLPLAGMTVAWCALNPELEIRLYGIIPILAKWLGVGTVLITFFTYAVINPLLGFCAITGCAASYYWIRARGWRDAFSYAYRAPQPKPAKTHRNKRDDDFSFKDLNPFERLARARRKKQFQRLFDDDEN